MKIPREPRELLHFFMVVNWGTVRRFFDPFFFEVLRGVLQYPFFRSSAVHRGGGIDDCVFNGFRFVNSSGRHHTVFNRVPRSFRGFPGWFQVRDEYQFVGRSGVQFGNGDPNGSSALLLTPKRLEQVVVDPIRRTGALGNFLHDLLYIYLESSPSNHRAGRCVFWDNLVHGGVVSLRGGNYFFASYHGLFL